MKQTNMRLGIKEIPRPGEWLLFSLQHLCAMFGATVLVPFLVGMSPATALFSSGLGTLAFILVTKGQVPAYLGSSFAFIVPLTTSQALGGIEGAMVGSFFAGLVYGIVALFIKFAGTGWITKVLPPIVVGPVIMVIGLSLATTAVGNAMYLPNSEEYSLVHIATAGVTLFVAVVATMYFKGFLNLIPILLGLIAGYLFALWQGLIDLEPIRTASWFSVPELIVPFVTYSPTVNWAIVAIMAPVALVTLAENTGQLMVLSKVAGKNFLKQPGMHRTVMGDGLATMIAAAVGGPPNTTYGENVGVVAITRVFSVFVVGGAAVLAIAFAFVGKVAALISSIPPAVMGGVSILLFGIIASAGIRMLVDNRVDMGEKRNMVIASIILVIGIGGAAVRFTDSFEIAGMSLATVIGLILHGLLPNRSVSYGQKDMFESDAN
ncbi:uracil-xanthine permease family protein [Shouchella clausii]|uniref:uracil-xanthine permease family protein n=1 Tax=Shouchella clausii TaxID=79880 RepID=UPI000BA62A46|nr:solute carrier family 23 protein [Shouchella clausii]PAD19366.1 uracil permease [Shouchella clausii]